MSIKIYPTEVEAVEDGRKIYTISIHEEGVYNLQLHTMFDAGSMDELFNSIRKAVRILEIEE